MTITPLPWLGQLTALDLAALIWAIVLFQLIGWLISHHPKGWMSTGEMVSAYRLLWMRRAARREVRVTDITLLALLRSSATFLASMTMFAIGGAVAMLGQFDTLESLAIDVAGGFDAPRQAQQVKLLCLIALLAFAFLKFIWSIRVFGYCAVVMGAMPGDQPDDTDEEIEREAERATAINKSAARNFNEGLRAIYFALAVLAWFLGALAFAVAATLTAAMLLRREFASETRRSLRFSTFRE